MTSIQLTALPDGAYRLKGDVTIIDRDRPPLPERGSAVYWCRCGRSPDKPVCDGSHGQTGCKGDA